METLVWEAKMEKPCGLFGQQVVTNPAGSVFQDLILVLVAKRAYFDTTGNM